MPGEDAAKQRDGTFEAALEPARLARLLLYGSPATRHQIAARLLANGNHELIDMLVATVRSTEGIELRARCLEVLGLIAAADSEQGAHILRTVVGEAFPVEAARS